MRMHDYVSGITPPHHTQNTSNPHRLTTNSTRLSTLLAAALLSISGQVSSAVTFGQDVTFSEPDANGWVTLKGNGTFVDYPGRYTLIRVDASGSENEWIFEDSLRIDQHPEICQSQFSIQTIGGTLTLTGDSPNGDMFQENSFIIALGPDDFKINFGYDWVRQQTYFSFVIAMDTKGSSIEFDKMEIKNPDRLARSDKKEVELNVYETENQVTSEKKTPKKMMYAEVIEIEDPDREQI